MEQAILPAVGRELEAVVHDAGRPQVPEIDVGAEVAGDVEIEQPVPVVVEPHRPIAVHPLAQSRGGGHVLEMQVAEVLEQLEVSPLVDEQVLEPVVVVVAPHGTHRHALAWAVQVGDARAPRDVDERAVAPVEIERVGESEPAVREVEVGPPVIVDVADGHRCPERRHERGDVVDPGIERGRVMHEIDSHIARYVAERKPRSGGAPPGKLCRPPAVQRDDREDGSEEHRGEGEPSHAQGRHAVNHIAWSCPSARIERCC